MKTEMEANMSNTEDSVIHVCRHNKSVEITERVYFYRL